MGERPLSKIWRALRILAGLTLLSFFGLFMAWYTFITVGYLNLTANMWWLMGETSLAMEYPLEPGEGALVEE